MKKIYTVALVVFLASIAGLAYAGEIPDSFWNARLWLSSQAFGLENDCPVKVLFQRPQLRSIKQKDGTSIKSTLLSQNAEGNDVVELFQTTKNGVVIARTTLRLRYHPEDNVVNVQSVEVSNEPNGDHYTLNYDEAVQDDDDYDHFTDTVVSIYRTFFDKTMIQ